MCALALRPYLKGRDLWDIYYLKHDNAVGIDWGLVRKKVGDYREEISDPGDILAKGLGVAQEKIKRDGHLILENEMERFLSPHVLESYRPSFDSILKNVLEATGENTAIHRK